MKVFTKPLCNCMQRRHWLVQNRRQLRGQWRGGALAHMSCGRLMGGEGETASSNRKGEVLQDEGRKGMPRGPAEVRKLSHAQRTSGVGLQATPCGQVRILPHSCYGKRCSANVNSWQQRLQKVVSKKQILADVIYLYLKGWQDNLRLLVPCSSTG